MKTITLYFKESSSDKVYQASIEPKGAGFVVNFAFGRRGSTLNSGSKTNGPVDLASAEKIFDKLVREKKAKGYTEGPDGTPYTSSESKEYSGILPQLLNPIEEDQIEPYLTNENWAMQEKFDGKRLLLLKQGKAVRGINRKGLFVGIPEGIKKDALRISNDFLMDGEAVGDLYYAFDLLEAQGADFRAYPYSGRLQHLLVRIIPLGVCSLRTVITVLEEDQKREHLAMLRRVHAEGVVFKDRNAPYTASRPNTGGPQLKCKFYATASFIVCGINSGKRSVSLKLLEDVEQVDAGNVTIPANHSIPGLGDVVEVRYLYAFRESGCIYQPVYLGKRDDVRLTECTVNQLKYRPATAGEQDIEES
jgi:bifunctional non-homologous end joining protein LigD